MKTKDEIKKDLLNNKKLQDENETSITRIIEQMPDQRILISESEGIYGQIFNGQHGSIKYVKGEKEQVIIRFSGGIGPVYKMDTAWGLQLNFNHLKIILTTENAVKYIKNHFYLTPSQTQKLMEILSYYVEDNTGTGNYLDYSPSPIKILDGVIHVDYEIGNNSKILSDLFNFYPKATHPDYFLENLGYNLISPFHNDLKHLGNSVIQTPLLLAEGVTKGAKTSIPVFFIGKGFALPKDKFLYGLERVKTQADLNVHANETNIPMIIDDVKTSWLEKNKDSLKSYVQTGVFADRGKQNGIELNELKGQRSIIFTLNDKYKIDTDLAITNRIFIERFTKFHSGRRNKPLFLKFEKSMPSGFMYSLIRELFDGKKIIDIYNEVENLEDPIDWLNYGIQYINSLCKKYNLPEFPSLKAKKLLDHDTNAMEVAQAFIGEWERINDSAQKSKVEHDFKIDEMNSRIYIYFTASAFKTLNSLLALHLPYDSAIDFINNVKSDTNSVCVENEGKTISVRVSKYPKKMFCISIPDSGDNKNNDNEDCYDLDSLPDGPVKRSLMEEQEASTDNKAPNNQANQDNPDIIYRKSQALATDISISDVFQRSGYNYYALDKSKNDIKGKAWQSYILKSQEITRKEFETMRGDSQ